MWAKAKASLLVLLMAWAVLPLASFGGHAPQPAGAGPQNVYLMSFASSDGLASLKNLNVKVLEDYGNGDYLVQGPLYSNSYLSDFGIESRQLAERTTVKFPAAGYSFDTKAGEPVLPSFLTTANSDEKIIQFIGPVRPEWTKPISNMGVQFGEYFDNYAFVAKMNEQQVAAASALPFVGWIGQYQPAFKIDSQLYQFAGSVGVEVIGYDSVSEQQLTDFLLGQGALIQTSSPGPAVAKAIVYASQIPAIARSPLVYQIIWHPPETLYDWQAGEIHQFHQAWTPSKSGLKTNLTGHSPGPDGIYGNADDVYEVIGIIDSGFDNNNQNAGWDDYFQGPLGDRVIRVAKWTTDCNYPDGRRSGVAHGTHVAGIIGSNGFDWETARGLPTDDMVWDQSEAGVAPESKLSFDCAGQGGGIVSNTRYWDLEYADGAKTMSNSYGNANRLYDNGMAGVADTKMFMSNDKMIIFAAGNDGPEENTVSGMAKAKNGLAIGASENFRPDQMSADNPNLVADFSSRGNPVERYKPDLVAVGTAVVSGLGFGEWIYNAQPSGQGVPQPDYILGIDVYNRSSPGNFNGDGITDYRYMQGTSMASPMAAGLYMLTREYFREVWGINNVNGQLAKAMLINGAVRMDPNLYAYPSIDQGWGRIDLRQSLFPPAPRTNQFEEGLFATTGRWTPSRINMNVQTPDVPLKVTLTWVEASGAALGRNLDLIVRDPQGRIEYHGNQYATSGPLKGWTDPADPGFDTINNVEQVEVKFPTPGTWSVEVIARNMPNATKFALVFSADVGPARTYQVNIYTQYPTLLTMAPGGTASLAFTVRNFGSGTDNITLFPDSVIGVGFDWTTAMFKSTEFKDNLATFRALPSTAAGLYDFCVKAESGDDPGTPRASDSLCGQIEVVDQKLPYPRRITTESIDELDPSVLTFNRSGINHIFIAYRKTTPVNPADLTYGGVNVWVAHNTVGYNHEPNGTWEHMSVSDWNDYPNDIRFLYIDWGTYAGRVVMTWTGQDPLETVPEQKPWGRIAYADYPYTTWTVTTIEKNYGSNVYNSGRVSFPIFRKVGGPAGTLAWVWEHLDSVSTTSNAIAAVQTHVAFSYDGGATWGDCFAIPSQCYLVAPRGTSNYYFFPNGVVDQNDVLWIFFYWRLASSGQGRRLAVALWSGNAWNDGWTNATNIWDAGSTSNVQFPAAVSTPEGGNRVYVAATWDSGGVDKMLYTMYIQGSFSYANPPRAAPVGGFSPDFSSPQGPLGFSVSDANYNRRPVLNIVYTDDGIVWVPYMERSNIYGTPNLWTQYSGSAFTAADRRVTYVTADAFAKGHQMSDTLTTGGRSCVYEVWHENIAPAGQVNYDVYLAIYCAGWESDPDNRGPVTVNQATIPNPYNRTYPSSFRIKADISDVNTGFNNITDAQLVPSTETDPALVDWTNAWPMNLTGRNRSPTETAWLWANWTVSGWPVGSCHRFWIRGQDSVGNWGQGDYVDVCVTQATVKPPSPPTLLAADLTGTGWVDVTLVFSKSFEDGNGANDVVKYKIWRATDSIYGPYANVDNVTATKATSYSWKDQNAGQGDLHNYFYYVTANSTAFDSKPTKLGAKFFRTMSAGKQLLSYPLAQSDYAPSKVLQTIGFDSVRTFDPCTSNDPWKSYKPGRPINDIRDYNHYMTYGYGYWVNMTAPGTMTVAGLVPENTILTLCAGWNLISFPSFNATYTLAQLNADLGNIITSIEVFDASSQAVPYYLQRVPQALWGSVRMQPGVGYWIYVRQTTQWGVPNY